MTIVIQRKVIHITVHLIHTKHYDYSILGYHSVFLIQVEV
jgi:hypothetical protein